MDAQQQLLDERHTALIAMIADRHVAVMDGLAKIHVRLDLLNGRTRESERHIAVLDDRSSRTNAVSISALSAEVVAAIYLMLR